MNTNRCTD